MKNNDDNKYLGKYKLCEFDNSYARLSGKFFRKVTPDRVPSPELIKFNEKLADFLNLNKDGLDDKTIANIFAGNLLPEGAEPISMAYAGHQFGSLVPSLGDGRALLIGEVTAKDNNKYDIQLKGSGVTPFSRRGDGKATLGSVIREYILSEAMHNLNIKTSRALAMVKTGELIQRESVEKGAVMTRVASGHIRIGTFEYFYIRDDKEALKILTDYAIRKHYKTIENEEDKYQLFLKAVLEAVAKLIVSWLSIGFIHGVMNTDNINIAGETIDYGPAAFIDHYNKDKVYSYIDQQGRYRFSNQPNIGLWNLARFAETILHLLDPDIKKAVDIANGILDQYNEIFKKEYLKTMIQKIGLTKESKESMILLNQFLDIIEKENQDYTLAFRKLADRIDHQDQLKFAIAKDSDEMKTWLNKWRENLDSEEKPESELAEKMRKVNPLFIPRNHKVEAAIRLAAKEDDYSEVEKILKITEKPFKYNEEMIEYAMPPKPEEVVLHTFCGT